MANGYSSKPQGVEGVKAVIKDKQRQIDALRSGGRVPLGSIGAPQLAPEVKPTFQTVTNLCTDPQPTDPTSWYGGDTGLVADSTYVSQGLHLQKNPAYFSSLGQFSLPGNSFVVDPGQSFFGSAARTFKVTADLRVSVRFRTAAEGINIVTNCRAYDAAGSYLGFFELSPASLDIPSYTAREWSGFLDFDNLVAAYPTVDSVWLGFIYSLPGTGSLPWFGSAMVVDASNLSGPVPYSDGTTPGWTQNEDGTSTGRADPESVVSWFDITNAPDAFPPSAHTHVAADVTDLATVVKAYTLDEFADPVADLNMDSHKLTFLLDGTDPQDAATISQLDAVSAGGLDDAGVAALMADDTSPSATRSELDSIIAASSGGVAIPATKAITSFSPNADDPTLTPIGFALGGVGSSSVPAVSATPATTNLHTSSKRIDLLRTSAATNNLVGMRGSRAFLWRGNAAGLGGFKFVTRFGPATGQTIASRLWVGLDNDISSGTDTQPSAQALHMVGVGYDSADTDLYVMHNAGTVSATKVATGLIRSSVDRAKVYTLTIECSPNGSSILVTVKDEVTGTTFSTTATTNLPGNATFLAPKWRASTGAVSSVIGLAVMGSYSESDH